MGKVSGGGIQEGRLRSEMAVFSPFTFGRLASSGEKTRLLMETTRKNRVTIPLAASSADRPAGRGRLPEERASLTCWSVQRAPVMRPT